MATADSDEIKDMYCEPCYKEGLKGLCAGGFCVECVEYLCDTCIRYHKKYKPDHLLQDKNTMPQEFCLEHCLENPKELIKFYCESCDVCACSICSVKRHSRCHGVQPLYRLASNFDTNEEFKRLNEQLNEVENDTNIVRGKLEANVVQLARAKQKIKTSLEDQKDQLIETFDIFKTEINKDVDKVRKDDGDKIQAQLGEVSIIESKILSVKATLKKASHGYKLFIESKKAKQLLKSLRLTLADLKNTTRGISEYKYDPFDVTSGTQFGVFKIGDQRRSISPVTAGVRKKADAMQAPEARFKVFTLKNLLNLTTLLCVFDLLLAALIIPVLYIRFGSADLSFVAFCKCVLKYVLDIAAVILLLFFSCIFISRIYTFFKI